MVAKEGNGKSQKESSWLHQMRDGSNKHSRGVLVTAMILLFLIAGGVALGFFMRRNAPAHQQPKAFGGSADSLATSTSVAVTPTPAPGPGHPSQTSLLHVSPTLTLNNREVPTTLAVRPRHFKIHPGRQFEKPTY